MVIMSQNKKKIKLAIFTGSDMRTFGGGEKYVVELVNRLKSFEIVIFSYNGKPPFRQTYAQIKKICKTKIAYYNAFELPLIKERFMFTLSGIKALNELQKFDVVYCLDNSFFTNLLLYIASRKYKFKYILGIHDANILKDKPIIPSSARRMLLKIYAPIRNFGIMHAPNIRVVNEADGEKLRNMGYKGQIYKITDFVNVGRTKVRINKNRFIVLFVGRLSIEHKGVDFLIEIINKVLKLNSNIFFDIVGSGDNGEKIVMNLVKKNPNNVKWLGFINEKMLSKEYAKANLLLFPSRFESFGLSLAEGQAYGLPAVAFNVRGPNVIIKNNLQGALIEPFHVNLMVSEVIKYYKLWKNNKKDYFRIKQSISKIITRRFGQDTIMPKIINMFTT